MEKQGQTIKQLKATAVEAFKEEVAPEAAIANVRKLIGDIREKFFFGNDVFKSKPKVRESCKRNGRL